MALESFLQQRICVAPFFQLCQEGLLLYLGLRQLLLELIASLADQLELFPVCPVFVPLVG